MMAEKNTSSSSDGGNLSAGGKGVFKHPPEWDDEERMHFLLAPFPPSHTHTSPTDPKVTFWTSLVLSSSREVMKPLFTERELMGRFQWNGISPACLPMVIEALERRGEITKLEEIEVGASVGWLGWGVGVVSKPVSWAWRNYVSPQKYEGQYVVLPLLKELADTILAGHQKTIQYKSTDRVLRYSEFQELCRGKTVSPEATRAVESYLIQKRLIVKATTKGGREVVKLVCSDEKTVKAIEDTDIGILSIKETVRKLSQQVTAMQQEAQRMRQTAKSRLKLKDRKGALQYLKRAKVVEASLSKKDMELHNLQTILGQIQMAETDAMVLKCYKSGTEALKSIRKSEGLTLENAESVMDELSEVLQENDEIADVLGGTLGEGEGEWDDDELMKELNSLLEPAEPFDMEEFERELAALDITDKEPEPVPKEAPQTQNTLEPTAPSSTRKEQLQPGDAGRSRRPKERMPLPA